MAARTPRGRTKAAKRAPPDSTRTPTQPRAQQTVDAILTACRALLLRDGVERVTTNGIARTAGVSIGSLYQYFGSRDAIIAELSRRHIEEVLALLQAQVTTLLGEDLETGARRLIHLMVEVHRRDPELLRIIESTRPALGARAHLERVQDRVMSLTVAYLGLHRHELVVDDLGRAAFVVIVTVEALTHNAVLTQPKWLAGDVLVNDITRLVLGYLTGHAELKRAEGLALSTRAATADRQRPGATSGSLGRTSAGSARPRAGRSR